MSADRSRSPKYLVPAEVGLLAVTIGTIYGFSRVFATFDFLLPMLVIGCYSHGVAMLTRRRGFSVPVAALIALPGFVLLSCWLFFFSTTAAGIPTAATWTATQNALSASWDTYQVTVAPAPALAGFVLASCAAVFFAVFLADWAAFRLWSAFEAIVPASTLFIFCSVLGALSHKVDSMGVFLAAVLGFLLLHRIARQETSAGWLSADVDRGSQAALRAGGALTAGALLIGIFVGPQLPGADSPAIWSARGSDSGPGSRVTISPLVDIRDRLTQKNNVEVFTVKSNKESYWRMTSLDTFVGDIWRSGGKYTSVDGELEVLNKPPVAASTVDQDYTITNLNVLWLPAAYEPVSVDSPRVDVRYQADSSTLIVDTSQADSNGMSYRVRSDVPTFTAEELNGANATISNEMRQRYLDLPAGFSPTARNIALEQTKDATTPYQKARKLQDYFLTNYVYDLQVPHGHGESAIDQFLQDKRGYCEQFSGTFAAMARSIGLPARVAVGFTQGQLDPVVPNLYHVRGEHAHAWPEVFLGQYGWVAFEPTPGRGAPGAEDYTGVPARQATDGTLDSSSTTSVVTTIVQAAPSSLPGAGSTLAPRELDAGAPAEASTTGAEEPPAWYWPSQLAIRFVVLATLALLLIGVYVALVLSLKASRRQARRHQAGDASAKVRVSWEESVEALALIGAVHRPSETHKEFAHRAAAKLGAQAAVLEALAYDVDAALYGPEVLDDEVAARAEHASSALLALVESRTKPSRQWRDRLDPRPLLPRRRPSTRRRASSTRD